MVGSMVTALFEHWMHFVLQEFVSVDGETRLLLSHQPRLHITANDLDKSALDWALASMASDEEIEHVSQVDDEQIKPEFIEKNGIKFQCYDARMAMVQGSFQWIDVDPFGSPITFIDGALQALGRVGVLEVTATDTAALTGSSASSGMRRYGHKGIVDLYAHDDAVRVLLGTIATRAAQLDRAIEPILALFDGHHVRVSVLVRKSKQGADRNRELMGWRVREKTNRTRSQPTRLQNNWNTRVGQCGLVHCGTRTFVHG